MQLIGAFHFSSHIQKHVNHFSIPSSNQYLASPCTTWLLKQYYECRSGAYLLNQEQLKAFLEKVKDSSVLQNKLKVAKSLDEVVSIAQKYGHEFTSEQISQLTEEELEGLAGGGEANFWFHRWLFYWRW